MMKNCLALISGNSGEILKIRTLRDFLAFLPNYPWTKSASSGTLKGAEVNDAKVILADEATRLCHGKEAAEKAKETARATFLAIMEWVTDYIKFQSQPSQPRRFR